MIWWRCDNNRMENLTDNCFLCPRNCGVSRRKGNTGFCGMTETVRAARAALHMWEEPCISGSKGSGAVFFSGCTLRCIFCQNHEIAAGKAGKEIPSERLAEIFIKLQKKGAANINLVTGSHFTPAILKALGRAKGMGLSLPIVFNCGGYESLQTLAMLEGSVDVYLPDFKYMDASLAGKFSHAPDYPERAKEAIAEMVRQTGPCVFDDDGYIRRGTIVRHLILPGHTRNSIDALRYLYSTYGNKIYISIMNQYTPVREIPAYPELNRRVTRREYEKVLRAALELGIENAYFQEGGTAEESFIPPFDLEGL